MAADVIVIGGGVVGCACALALARRGAAVTLLEALPALGLQASGTNSGILHTGFDSTPGELETELILRAAQLRPALLAALGVPFRRTGAVLRPRDAAERETVTALAARARGNGVAVELLQDGTLVVPGEGITDPVAFTLALAAAAARHGAQVVLGAAVTRLRAGPRSVRVQAGGRTYTGDVAVNAAGLGAGAVARMAGDTSFDVHPRKGEFFVFDVPPPERILLPVPTRRTKGVLVFGTLDGRTVAGPTAVDLDAADWTVREEAREEIVGKAAALHPPVAGAEPVFAYAGLRPAGCDGVNYVVRRSAVAPALVHAAAIRSTGLTASPAIAERVAALAGFDGPEAPLLEGPAPVVQGPWWQRSAAARA